MRRRTRRREENGQNSEYGKNCENDALGENYETGKNYDKTGENEETDEMMTLVGKMKPGKTGEYYESCKNHERKILVPG